MRLAPKFNNERQIGNITNERYNRNHNNNNNNKNYDGKAKHQTSVSEKTCSHCGWRNHKSIDCRYKQNKCNFCKKIGHLASVCRGKNKTVNYVSESESNTENFNKINCNDFSIYSIEGS